MEELGCEVSLSGVDMHEMLAPDIIDNVTEYTGPLSSGFYKRYGEKYIPHLVRGYFMKQCLSL